MKFWKIEHCDQHCDMHGKQSTTRGQTFIYNHEKIQWGGGFTLFSAPQDAELITLANVCCDSWIIIEISLIPFQTLLTNCIKLCKAVAKRWFSLSSVVCTDM